MNLDDVAALVHFRELNFLPRVIFSIGVVLFIGSFFTKLFLLGVLGVGLIFGGSALNLAMTAMLSVCPHWDQKDKTPWALILQALLAVVLSIATLWLFFHSYRHGGLPSFLRPLH